MTSPRDALNELRWRHGEAALAACEVAYVHRGAPDDTAHVRGSDITAVRRSFFDLASGASIPYHRVLRITHRGEVVWARRSDAQPAAPVPAGAGPEEDPPAAQGARQPEREDARAASDGGGGGGDRATEERGRGPDR